MIIEEINISEAKIIQEGMRQVIKQPGYGSDAKNEAFDIAIMMERTLIELLESDTE